MSLSTCEHCGGFIPIGPDESNRCEICGAGVFDLALVPVCKNDGKEREMCINIKTCLDCRYLVKSGGDSKECGCPVPDFIKHEESRVIENPGKSVCCPCFLEWE
jgi:hypothetical protein